MSNEMIQKARQFALLKQRKEDLEATITSINKALEALGTQLFGDFTDSGMVNIRVEGAAFVDAKDRIIRPDMKFRASVKNEPVFFQYLRESGNASMIKETVHHATLEKFITLCKEQNKPLPDSEVLDVFTVETVKVTRAPKG